MLDPAPKIVRAQSDAGAKPNFSCSCAAPAAASSPSTPPRLLAVRSTARDLAKPFERGSSRPSKQDLEGIPQSSRQASGSLSTMPCQMSVCMSKRASTAEPTVSSCAAVHAYFGCLSATSTLTLSKGHRMVTIAGMDANISSGADGTKVPPRLVVRPPLKTARKAAATARAEAQPEMPRRQTTKPPSSAMPMSKSTSTPQRGSTAAASMWKAVTKSFQRCGA
mmetsp:Transcript_79534/g.257582  ORF Transcript_79534/g.257582 Transcript_79534/m.257582 type:complete len:222 (-) Transcript_79534:2672-3337(-)